MGSYDTKLSETTIMVARTGATTLDSPPSEPNECLTPLTQT